MGLSINSNVGALGANRQLQRNQSQLVRGLGKLATGLRINSARDDAAGLAIAEGFQSQTRQYRQEVNNLQSGISAAQTAEGAMGTMAEELQRVRELALQAANGTLNDNQRAALNQEAQQIVEQINATANDTEFNGMNLLDGSTANVPLGTEADTELDIQNTDAAALGIDSIDISTAAGATAALGAADAALNQVSTNRANVGAQQNRFESAINQREQGALSAAQSESQLRDLDFARAVIDQTRSDILRQTSVTSLLRGNITNQAAAQLLGG